MGLKAQIIILIAVLGRFLIDFYSVQLSSDVLALFLVLIVANKYPRHFLTPIALLITLSVFYYDLLTIMNLPTDLSLIAALGAVITLLISYLPIYGNINQ